MVITAFSFSSVAFAAPTDEAALMKEAKVSKADAEKTALAKLPNGTIKSEEVEREHAKLVWPFDIAKPGTSRRYLGEDSPHRDRKAQRSS